MKCNQSRPGFELVSPCQFPTTITTSPRAPPYHNDWNAELWPWIKLVQSPVALLRWLINLRKVLNTFTLPDKGKILSLLFFCQDGFLKLVDKFTFLGCSVSSTEKYIDTRLTKAWTAIDRLSIIWKSDLTDKMKRSFFQAAVVSMLIYGCTTWTLTKRLEKKLDGNYTRMLRAILNKPWRQHPTRHQLYGHMPSIT